MKFWTKRIAYTWHCAYCNRGVETIMTDDTEPYTDPPLGWWAVISSTATPSIFCSLICLGKYYNR